MAKKKNNRIANKRNISKPNPFELHINKQKLVVLGRKTKNDKGRPGVARAKALQKRKQTLLHEYKNLNKTNQLKDRRIGEFDARATPEGKMTARYTSLKSKAHRKSIYNLADEELLTHHGQILSEIEKFNDHDLTGFDGENRIDENDADGNLGSDFVEDAHFGGGLLRKKSGDGELSHRDLIQQLIVESKKRKAEKQKVREHVLEMTEKLDAEWKDLLPLLTKKNEQNESSLADVPKSDDYDRMIRELKFEARGVPSDRLKSEDEIVREEKEKLESLERDRLERMRGDVKPSQGKNHRSADDLDDNFEYDTDLTPVLSYDSEGKSNLNVTGEIIRTGETSGSENNSEEESEGEDEDGTSVGEDTEPEDSNDVREDNSGNKCAEENDSDFVDNLSDLKEDDEESEEDVQHLDYESEEICEGDQSSHDERADVDRKQREELMEIARRELPYTFSLPDSYESLHALLHNRTVEEQTIIMERMIKCNHSRLAESNKEGLRSLFIYLLQYFNDLSSDCTGEESVVFCFRVFHNLIPCVFDLCQFDAKNSCNAMISVLKEKYDEFNDSSKYPGLDVLLFLELVSFLFPTSDFRHSVTTPAIIFIDQMLTKCKVRDRRDITYGLFLVTLTMKYTVDSKRILPSSLNFLNGIVYMAIPKNEAELLKIPPPFKPNSNFLVLSANCTEESIQPKLNVKYLKGGKADDQFCLNVLYLTLRLLQDAFVTYKHLPSCGELFESTLKYIQMISECGYPTEVSTLIKLLKSELEQYSADRRLVYITAPQKRPRALRLYEPQVEKVYDTKKWKVQSKEKAERDKLIHKLRREKKGALREIRLDRSFLSKLKIKEQTQRDTERREKVKRLFADAAMQQSELNSMDRNKKKKKRM